jgi:hypothetical protein
MNFWSSKTFETSPIILGGTAGAAGWIYGASENLARAGCMAEARLVFLCAACVVLTGGIIWLLWLVGCRLSALLVIDLLLGASFLFGVLALWVMQSRGVLAVAIDPPAGRYPEWLAWTAPVVLLIVMGITWFAPVRKRLQPNKLERSDSAAPQSPR